VRTMRILILPTSFKETGQIIDLSCLPPACLDQAMAAQ
jgi:hypothetical protein